MSSAPFPGEESLQDLAHPKHGIFVVLEDEHVRGMVPSFYNDHPNKDIVVKHKGEPILSCGKPFTVGQVPIERRWAIGYDGEVVDELNFRKLHIQWYEEYFRELVRLQPDLKGKMVGGQPDYDIPDPVRFVAVQVDPTNPKKFVPVNYAPHETAGARPDSFYSRDGEKLDKERLEILTASYADPKLRAKMKPYEIAEVESTLGIAKNSGSDGIASKLELLNSMLQAGDLSPEAHSKQVALLTAKPMEKEAKPASVEPEEKPEIQAPMSFTETARCGKTFTKKTERGALGAVRFHQRRCPSCNPPEVT